MTTTNLNQKIASFLSNLTEQDYQVKHIFSKISEAAASINLTTMDSGWSTPKAIEIKGIDGIFFLRENKELNYEFKAIQKDGKIQVLEMTSATYNKFENWYRNNI